MCVCVCVCVLLLVPKKRAPNLHPEFRSPYPSPDPSARRPHNSASWRGSGDIVSYDAGSQNNAPLVVQLNQSRSIVPRCAENVVTLDIDVVAPNRKKRNKRKEIKKRDKPSIKDPYSPGGSTRVGMRACVCCADEMWKVKKR